MTIQLTPDQGRRIQAVINRGAFTSVEEVVEAALTAVEQRGMISFGNFATTFWSKMFPRLPFAFEIR